MTLPFFGRSVFVRSQRSSGTGPARRRRRLAARRLRLESLESRLVMSGVPVLHSHPGAPASLYLDFDGHVEAGVTTPAYDTDGNPAAFNADEAAYIDTVWRTVAEDFAPFNINVTTVEPAVLAEGVPSNEANGVALRVAIGGTSEAFGGDHAGWAYPYSFTNSAPNVSYAFPQALSGSWRSAVTIGTTVSHEAGHAFGLRHFDGAYDFYEHWQAIMNDGVYGFEDATWISATNNLGDHQDDMAVLAGSLNGFGYRADDHAGTIAGATPLAGSGAAFSGSGVVSTTSDVDVFSITTAAPGGFKVAVQGSEIGQNLDAVVQLLDASGNAILTADPSDSHDAEIIIPVHGTAYIAVRSAGEYGRVGQYTVAVTESLPGIRVKTAAETLTTSESGANDSFTVTLNSRPASDVVIGVASSDTGEGSVSTGQLTFTPENWHLPQTVTVTGVDDGEVDGVTPYSVSLGPVSSADPNYAGMTLSPLSAANADDDHPGWAFHLDSGSGNIYAKDLKVDASGNLLVVGTLQGTADFDPGPAITTLTGVGVSNSFIAKYSPARELIWARHIGGSDGNTFSNSLEVDSSGNVYVAGDTSSTAAQFGAFTVSTRGSSDAYVAKLDANGNFLWVRSWGSTGSDAAKAIDVDANGVLHIAGAYSGTVDFNPGSGTFNRTSSGGLDSFISRFTSGGSFLSATVFGGPETVSTYDLAVDAAGNEYVAGFFYGAAQFGSQSLTSAGGRDQFLLKLNAAGSIEWTRQATGASLGSLEPLLALGSDGTVTFAAYFTEEVGFGAGTPTLTSAGDQDVYLTRWDANGALLQVGQLTGLERVRIAGLEMGADDSPHVYGDFIGTADLDPGPGVVNVTSQGARSDFVLRLTPDYQLVDVSQVGRDAGISRALTLDARGNIYASGQFTGGLAKMPTGQLFSNDGGIDSYVVKLTKAPGIVVESARRLETSEGGASASFQVVLETPPTSDVTITVASSDTSEGTVSPALLTFTPDNWSQPQTVTVTGVDDALNDGDIPYTILLRAATSADSGYAGLDPSDVSVVNTDNDAPPTKFYVVNDASQDRTYEYDPSGALVESYGLNSGNTQPRGAASNLAGDRVWVADKNRKVYVYDVNGGLLGSWSAGALSTKAQVEGVATNGTDVWIVDNYANRVYRYTGAAGRVSGSRNAAGSFALNKGNTNPKGIVTDGTYVWVVNDASTDKVFKYTLSGSLVASWTIDSRNKTPTGLTIDPSGGSQDLWIVDSGTDRVYQYTNGRSKSSGSLSAAMTFALAAGNTNPQGIADPPSSAAMGDGLIASAAGEEAADTRQLDSGHGAALSELNSRLYTAAVFATLASSYSSGAGHLEQATAVVRRELGRKGTLEIHTTDADRMPTRGPSVKPTEVLTSKLHDEVFRDTADEWNETLDDALLRTIIARQVA